MLMFVGLSAYVHEFLRPRSSCWAVRRYNLSRLRFLERELRLHKLIINLDEASEVLLRNPDLSSVGVEQEPRDLGSNDRLQVVLNYVPVVDFGDQAALHSQLEVETLDVVKPETITALSQRLAGRRFDVLLIVVGRKSQSLPSYLKETFTFVR